VDAKLLSKEKREGISSLLYKSVKIERPDVFCGISFYAGLKFRKCHKILSESEFLEQRSSTYGSCNFLLDFVSKKSFDLFSF